MDLELALTSLRAGDPLAPGVVTMATDADEGAITASGLAVAEHSLPLTADTRLYAASLAKLVTGLCAHRLALTGRLHLDDPLAQWFPGLADGHRITVRQLLLHRSGLPEYHALRLIAGYSVDDRLEHADIRRLVDGMTTWFEPGSRVSYNNTNFAILAMVVCEVTGESFAEAARRLVLDPAEMATALVKERSDAIVEHSAEGYVPDAGGFRRAVMGLASTGDGGLWWSGTDLAAFGRWLLGGHPEVEALRERVPLPDGSLPTLASGCSVATDGSWFGGAAEFTGFAAELRVYPDHRVAIGAMSNRQDGRPGRRLDDLAQALGLPAPAPVEPPRRRVGAAPAGTLIGVGGAPWSFRSLDTSDASSAAIAVSVGNLAFQMIPAGDAWQVDGVPTHTAGWEGDDFVVREGPSELARLSVIGGPLPSPVEAAGLAGWWWCPPALSALHLIETDGDLSLQRGQTPAEPLVRVGERSGRWVLAAPWGLLEFERDGRAGRVVLHRAEGLELVRLAADAAP